MRKANESSASKAPKQSTQADTTHSAFKYKFIADSMDELNKFMAELQSSPIANIQAHFQSAGHDKSSIADCQRTVAIICEVLTDLKTNKKNFAVLLELLLEKSKYLGSDVPELKTILHKMIRSIAKHCAETNQFRDATKNAFAYLDSYFNLEISNNFLAYHNWRTSASVMGTLVNHGFINTIREKINSDDAIKLKKESAVWAEYLSQKIMMCASNQAYYNLLLDMTAILNHANIDVTLQASIVKTQQQIIAYLMAGKRVPEFSIQWVYTIGYTQPKVEQGKAESLYYVLQRKAKRDRQPETEARTTAELVVEQNWQQLQKWKEENKIKRHQTKIEKFRDTLVEELVNRLLVYKCLATGKLPVDSGPEAQASTLLLKAFGKVSGLAAVPGGEAALDFIEGQINANGEALQKKAIENVAVGQPVKYLAQIDELVEKLSSAVTLTYLQQIMMIETVTNPNAMKEFAQCAVERIFKYMESGKPQQLMSQNANFSIDALVTILTRAVGDYAMFHGIALPFMASAITPKELLASVCIPSGPKFYVEEYFSKPGIVIIDGDKLTYYYRKGDPNGFGGLNMIKQYGFKVGTLADVREWDMEIIPTELLGRLHLQNTHPAVEFLKLNQKEAAAVELLAQLQQEGTQPIAPTTNDAKTLAASVAETKPSAVSVPVASQSHHPRAMPNFHPNIRERVQIIYDDACLGNEAKIIEYAHEICLARINLTYQAHYKYWTLMAADLGDAKSCFAVGRHYAEGKYTFTGDRLKAKKYLSYAITHGDESTKEEAVQFLSKLNIPVKSSTPTMSFEQAAISGITHFTPQSTTASNFVTTLTDPLQITL